MIISDTHSHTLYSHAADTVADMARAAADAGLKVYGFTEHSPRPEDCQYEIDYREHLAASFPRYLEEVKALQAKGGPVDFLLGIEVDWLDNEMAHITGLLDAEDYDYALGSVHFLGRWPIDGNSAVWDSLDDAARFERYALYFRTLKTMAESRLFHIAAHPDIVKIYTVETFHKWLAQGGENLELIRGALLAMRDSGMSMEVSSAGIRKPCEEIYPGPVIMGMAAEMGLPISFASDAHATWHVGYQFDRLAAYGREFGYRTARYYKHKQPVDVEF